MMIGKFFAAIFSTGVFVAVAAAQVSPEQEILSAREESFNSKARSIELERMKNEAKKRPSAYDSTVRLPEIKEDFEQIQKINGDVFKLAAAGTPINYAAVFKIVSEISRRTARLKSNLFPAETKAKKNEQQTVAEPQDLKTLLTVLDKSINSFVHNSIFQNLNIVVTADSLKAQKDLETVASVSRAIKAKTKNSSPKSQTGRSDN